MSDDEFSDDELEEGDQNLLEKILNGDYYLTEDVLNYKWENVTNIEFKIIIKVINDEEYDKEWIEWCNNTMSDCKLLFLILNKEETLPKINNFDPFFCKKLEGMSYDIFVDIVNQIDNDTDFNRFIPHYALIRDKQLDIYWNFLCRKEFDRYLKFSEIYPFDAMNFLEEIKFLRVRVSNKTRLVKFMKSLKGDKRSLCKIYCKVFDKSLVNCPIHIIVSITETMKGHITDSIEDKEYRSMFIKFIAAGMINDFLDSFYDEIDLLIKKDRKTFIANMTIFNNIKLIDYLLCKYSEYIYEINYSMIRNSKMKTVYNYFSDITQDKLDELIRKIKNEK